MALAVAAVVSVVAGAAAFAVTARTSFWTALYWAVTTATTVGYGDVTPPNSASRVVAVVVMGTAIPALAGLFAVATSWHLHRRHIAPLTREAQAARRIAADLYRRQTGSDHPLAGDGDHREDHHP